MHLCFLLMFGSCAADRLLLLLPPPVPLPPFPLLGRLPCGEADLCYDFTNIDKVRDACTVCRTRGRKAGFPSDLAANVSWDLVSRCRAFVGERSEDERSEDARVYPRPFPRSLGARVLPAPPRAKFLRLESTRKSLNVREDSAEWQSCNMKVNQDFSGDWMRNFDGYVPPMLEDGVSVLIYGEGAASPGHGSVLPAPHLEAKGW